MTDYSSRFRAANIQQLQQVCALLCEGHRKYLVSLFDEFPEGEHLPVEWPHQVFDKRLDAILSAPADTDEKPRTFIELAKAAAKELEGAPSMLAVPNLDPAKPDRVIRSGDLVVGRRYRIVAISAKDPSPAHSAGFIATCIGGITPMEAGQVHSWRSETYDGWYFNANYSGTYASAVELVEDEAEQQCGCSGSATGEWYCKKHRVDPAIIRAAEGVVLEPGEYRSGFGFGEISFTITTTLPAMLVDGEWSFGIGEPIGRRTAVRRVEPQAPQEISPAGSAGTCDGTNGAASGPVAQQPAQPAGESQPEGECASSVATTLNDWHRVNAERQHEAFAPPHPLMALVACVQEEVGELAGAVLGVTGEKKRKAHKTRDDVLDAVADAMTYLSLIATNQGCDDLEKLLGDVFNMVSERAGSKLRTGLGQPLKTTEVARVYKERAEKAEQESSLQRDRAKRAELRLEQAERECAELRSELELLKEAESSISRSFAAYRNEAMGRSDAASHAVKELTEKLATYEREAKAWEVIERYRESQGDADVVIHFQHNSASSPAIRIGAFSETGISRLAAWCESQLNKESE